VLIIYLNFRLALSTDSQKRICVKTEERQTIILNVDAPPDLFLAQDSSADEQCSKKEPSNLPNTKFNQAIKTTQQTTTYNNIRNRGLIIQALRVDQNSNRSLVPANADCSSPNSSGSDEP